MQAENVYKRTIGNQSIGKSTQAGFTGIEVIFSKQRTTFYIRRYGGQRTSQCYESGKRLKRINQKERKSIMMIQWLLFIVKDMRLTICCNPQKERSIELIPVINSP